ncbi:MAG TPA: hypothetical protein VGO93_13235 [Candidatus Xenobia bacterium]|jgi:hypothetical protein
MHKLLRLLGALFFLGLAVHRLYPLLAPKVKVDHTDIYYVKGASQSDAQAVGRVLQKLGYTTGVAKSVRVTKEDGQCHLQFVVKNDAWNQPDMTAAFGSVCMQVSNQALGSVPVVVDMCSDDGWTVKHSQAVDTVNEYVAPDSKDDFWYSRDFSPVGVAAVESAVHGYGFNGAVFGLDKTAGKDVLAVIVKDGTWNNPKLVNEFKEIGGKVADALHAPSLAVVLCGKGLTDQRATVGVR